MTGSGTQCSFKDKENCGKSTCSDGDHIDHNSLDKFQSGFHWSNTFQSLKWYTDAQWCRSFVLVLLDIYSLWQTGQWTSIWSASYLSDRSFSTLHPLFASLSHGVPQGSFLGPLLFALYRYQDVLKVCLIKWSEQSFRFHDLRGLIDCGARPCTVGFHGQNYIIISKN